MEKRFIIGNSFNCTIRAVTGGEFDQQDKEKKLRRRVDSIRRFCLELSREREETMVLAVSFTLTDQRTVKENKY